MKNIPLPPNNTRIGFYYFPDSLHFRENDLHMWLPELKALGASWLTVVTPPDRAIPEFFLRGLLSAGIQPILHFNGPVDAPPPLADLRLLLQTYARWGLNYVAIFDKPNTRSAWSSTSWAQSSLVERFLDMYLPLAETTVQAGLVPVFPPLEPGGDYWDTAFLRAALLGLQRRASPLLLDRLVLGAYAWTGGHSLNWGAGGPDRWPAARPYLTPNGSEDQRGFRIFDWYLAQARQILQRPACIILLGAGARLGEVGEGTGNPTSEDSHARKNLDIAALMRRTDTHMANEVPELEPVSEEVLVCNFWLLSATKDSPYAQEAWFRPYLTDLPAAGALRQWVDRNAQPAEVCIQRPVPVSGKEPAPKNGRPISHYLLLPTYEWGVSDWHLDVIRPYIKKHRPTIGFSIEEAKRSAQVTVVGGSPSFSEAAIEQLRSAGCAVHQISGDGTTIATQLASL
jgi:hypothetical protein